MTEVIMPKMGDGMEEGTLLEWLKKDGDKVKTGEVIGTIQTDKATLELEAPGSGILTGFLIQIGVTVPVGVPIAAILKDGETLPEGWGSGGGTPAAAVPAEEGASTVAPPIIEQISESDSRVKASPLARKIAAEAGLDLARVAGSGPGGRIVEKDVKAALASGPVAAPPVVASPAPAAPRPVAPAFVPAPNGQDQKVPLTPIRAITAKRTLQSKLEAPHFYVTVEVDVDRIMQLRDIFKAEGAAGISVNDFVVGACARALREVPAVNGSFAGDHVLLHGAVNIGMAVALDDGLTVPVLRHADQMTLRQIAAASKDLAVRARENRLGLDELSGSTFSVSNMGMLDVDVFAAIINTPNAAILAVSSARRKPVVSGDDELEIRWRMNVTGSFDHRVVDGAVGAQFMGVVRSYLENPSRLLS